MKRKILFSFIGIFLLIGMVSAGIISINVREKVIPSDELTKFESVGVTELSHTSLECDEKECNDIIIESEYSNVYGGLVPYWMNCSEYGQTKIRSDGREIIECLSYVKIPYTDEQMKDKLDLKITSTQDRILNRIDINKESIKTERVSEGVVEFKSGVIRK